ncbi:MAG: hypothetical protein RBU37_21550 [Myxococcota bacterium]|jgi:hypothetical protein|nr:hypothetical protein [Myxococcota bacterium]
MPSPSLHASILRLVIASAALLTLGACALFGIEDNFSFKLPIEHTQKIPLPQIDLPSEGAGERAPQDITLPFSIPAIPVDLASASPDLKSNRDKLQRLELTALSVDAKSNTLSSALPSLDLYVGPLSGATVSNSVKIATIPPIDGAFVGKKAVPIDAAAMDEAQPYLTSLEFSFLIGPLVVMQGQTIPGGSALLELELTLRAEVDPTK